MTQPSDRRRKYHADLDALRSALANAETLVAAIDLHLAAYQTVSSLAEAIPLPPDRRPMWPALPAREAMEARNGGAPSYLYLYWHMDRSGQYQGPAGVRKTYIGADRNAQWLARQLIAHRAAFDDLTKARDQLDHLINRRVADIALIARAAEHMADDADRLLRRAQAGQPSDAPQEAA